MVLTLHAAISRNDKNVAELKKTCDFRVMTNQKLSCPCCEQTTLRECLLQCLVLYTKRWS